MVYQNNLRAIHSPGEDDVTIGSQNQQRARLQLARSWRRLCRQTTSEWQGRSQVRALQVYRFRSRAPSTSVHYNGEGSLGFSRILAPTGDGKIMEMLARSASYWMQQEPARCWVRDCTGLACSAAGHLLLGEEDRLTSLIREEFLSVDEDSDSSSVCPGTASSQADVTSDGAPRSLAEEYSLAPLNIRKKYSAQSFDQQVANYFKQL
ncbi:unnamed protein product [Bubo scandiacus]